MKVKTVNAQLNNLKTYQMYVRQMAALAENVFEYKNLPEYIDVAYINKRLLRQGAIAFFNDEVMGVIALPFNTVGNLDCYGRPLQIEVYGDNNYHRYLNRKEFVIMYDNNGRYPLILDVIQMAQRIALCVRTNDINIHQQKTPRVWRTSKDQELSLKGALNEVDSMEEQVVTYESLDLDDVNSVLTPAPYVADKIDLHLRELWAEFYRLIGVANLQEQKRERVIIDEMMASQGGTVASRFSRFQPRKKAIEEINKKWGLNIEVQYYDGDPSSIIDSFDRDLDNNDNDGENEDVSDLLPEPTVRTSIS